VATLEHTESAVVFVSGMAALSACLLAACRQRQHGAAPLLTHRIEAEEK